MNHITVAYAIAEDYEYSIISMLSLLKSADETTFCHIVVLVDDMFSDTLKLNMRNCLAEYINWDMQFYSVGDTFSDASSSVDWIKVPTYYRLVLPTLLSKEKRCIYLDADTIVCQDLWEIYNAPMKDCYLAGVKAPGYMLSPNAEEHCRQTGMPDLQQYINAGVLVMNLEMMRRDNLTERFLELIPCKFDSQDQDIINTVCYGNIYFLPFQYNVMTKYILWKNEDYPQEFSSIELYSAWSSPIIIHYADRIKPWNNPDCPMGDYWWNICKSSNLWDYFYKRLENYFFGVCVYKNNKDINAFSTKKQGKLFDFTKKQKVVIYGAGERAHVALEYLRECGIIPEYFLVSEKNGNKDYIDNIPVYALDEISDKNKDTLLVIGTAERFHPEIINAVLSYNFESIVPMSDTFR